MNTSKARLPYAYGLDIVRFMCALMVSVFHLTWRNVDTAMYSPFGWVGVQVIFVISGAVIANSAAAATPYEFVKGRFMRLHPTAWIAALVSGAVLLLVPRSAYQALGIGVIPLLGAFVRSLSLLGDYALASSYWTLPIELSFYGLVLVSLLVGGAERLRTVARLLVVISVPYVALLSSTLLQGSDASSLDLGYGLKNMLLLRHGLYFAIGIYVWMVTSQRTLKSLDYILLWLAIGFSGLEILCRALQIQDNYASRTMTAMSLAVCGFLLFLALLGVIHASLRYQAIWAPGARAKNWIRTAGLVTYPFYLIHEVVGGAALHYATSAGINRGTSVAIAIVIVGLVAYLIARHAEPVLRRRMERFAHLARVRAAGLKRA